MLYRRKKINIKRRREDSNNNYKDSAYRSDAERYLGGIRNWNGKEKRQRKDSGVYEAGIDVWEGGERGLEGGGGVASGIYGRVYEDAEKVAHGSLRGI